jgi:hypothetical protein
MPIKRISGDKRDLGWLRPNLAPTPMQKRRLTIAGTQYQAKSDVFIPTVLAAKAVNAI